MKVLIVDETTTFGGAFEEAVILAQQFHDFPETEIAMVTAQKLQFVKERIGVTIPISVLTPTPNYNSRNRHPTTLQKMIARIVDPLSSVNYCAKLCRVIYQTQPDIVHLNNLINVQQTGAIAAALLRKTCVSVHRDFECNCLSARLASRLATHHVAISSTIKENLLTLGIPEQNITVIWDGIDIHRFELQAAPETLKARWGIEADFTFGIFGRLVEWKGHELFLHTAKSVLNAVPNSHALIVGSVSDGDPAYEIKLRALAQSLGIAERVTFTGYVSDVPSLMSTVDVVLHLSKRAEPFGLVVAEAMAIGKPVVALRRGGPAEIITDETGVLVDQDSTQLISDATTELLINPERRATIGSAARRRIVAHFSAEICGKRYQSLYQRLTQKK